MSRKLLAPSILSADFGNLQRDFEMINESAADWFHVDVMDGRFVPNISFGFPVLKAVQKHAKKFVDTHLMIVEPERYVEAFAKGGSHMVTVHHEACTHLHRVVQLIKNAGAQAGVALNPATPVSVLEDIISDIDMVLVMSVNPGFGGQKFIENTYKKVAQAKDLIVQHQSKALIEVDGGVNAENAAKLYELGADVLVAGSAVFSADQPQEMMKKIKGLI